MARPSLYQQHITSTVRFTTNSDAQLAAHSVANGEGTGISVFYPAYDRDGTYIPAALHVWTRYGLRQHYQDFYSSLPGFVSIEEKEEFN